MPNSVIKKCRVFSPILGLRKEKVRAGVGRGTCVSASSTGTAEEVQLGGCEDDFRAQTQFRQTPSSNPCSALPGR